MIVVVLLTALLLMIVGLTVLLLLVLTKILLMLLLVMLLLENVLGTNATDTYDDADSAPHPIALCRSWAAPASFRTLILRPFTSTYITNMF